MSDQDEEQPKPTQGDGEPSERGDYVGEDGIAVAEIWGEAEVAEERDEDDTADT